MRVVKYVLLSLYLLFVILNTILLFTIDDFGSSHFGDTVILGLNNKVNDYEKGSLIVANNNLDDIKVNDNILYYDVLNSKRQVKMTKVLDIINKKDTTIVINDGLFLSDKYLLGKDKVLAIPFIGYLYNLFTGKVGYLIFIVIPIIFMFIYQIFKYRKENEKNKSS